MLIFNSNWQLAGPVLAWTLSGPYPVLNRRTSGEGLEKLGHPLEKLGHPLEKLGDPLEKLGDPLEKLGHPLEKLGQNWSLNGLYA